MDSAIRDIWRAYQRAPLSCKVRVVVRYLSCPFHSLLPFFPSSGQFLDVGCGDGLLLFLLSRHPSVDSRKYVGIDIDQKKIMNAQTLQIDKSEFRHERVSNVPSESFDCVSVMDVLYLLPISDWPNFLGHCVRVLKADGFLIIKENNNAPRWKYWLAYLQELISIYITRMTQGGRPHLESVELYCENIRAAGGNVLQVKRVDKGFPYPHVMFLARKV